MIALEAVALRIKRLLDWFGRVDVMLATVHRGNITEA